MHRAGLPLQAPRAAVAMPSVNRRRGGYAQLNGVELAWVVRELAKLTDKPFSKIGEALSNHVLDNEASISEYDYTLGMNVGAALETLWYGEGIHQPGPDAERALRLIKRVLEKEA